MSTHCKTVFYVKVSDEAPPPPTDGQLPTIPQDFIIIPTGPNTALATWTLPGD